MLVGSTVVRYRSMGHNRDMERRIAVITGGTRGLGLELARAFHRNGYRIATSYVNSSKDAERLVEEVGDDLLAIRADVSSAEDMKRMADEVSRRFGPVDVLVNNAGITKDSLLIRQSEDDWDRIIGVNLTGAFIAMRAFVPLMREGGQIVSVSSYSGQKGKEGQAAYSASKAGLLGLTRTAAVELAGQGIRVNAILPGYMATEMGMQAGSAMDKAREDSLLHTLSDPQEVAEFILYLSGTKNITGQVFSLDSRII